MPALLHSQKFTKLLPHRVAAEGAYPDKAPGHSEVGTWNPTIPQKKNRLQIPKMWKIPQPVGSFKKRRDFPFGHVVQQLVGHQATKPIWLQGRLHQQWCLRGVNSRVGAGEWLGPHLQIWKPYIGYICKPYLLGWWVYPLLFGNHRSLDSSTYQEIQILHISSHICWCFRDPPYVFLFNIPSFKGGRHPGRSDIRPCWLGICNILNSGAPTIDVYISGRLSSANRTMMFA